MNEERATVSVVDGSESRQVDPTEEAVDCWALVEVFGHSKVAGRVTTRKFGTEVMFQVDVPHAGADGLCHSELYNPKAVFAIKPTTESWCRRWAKAAKDFEKPVLPYIPGEPAALIGAGNDPDDSDP